MEITFVVSSLDGGGAETVLTRLAIQLQRNGHSTRIITILDERGPQALRAECESANVEVWDTGFNRSRLGAATNVVRFAWKLWRRRPTTIQGWMYHGSALATLLAGIDPGIEGVAWSIHHMGIARKDLKPATWVIVRALGLYAQLFRPLILNCSRASICRHEEVIGVPKGTQKLLRNGVDTDSFVRNISDRTRFRRHLRVAERDILVALVARAHPHKDHHNFLRAAALARCNVSRLKFLLCGAGVTTNTTIANGIRELELGPHVYFLEHQSDVRPVLNGADILCLSSYTEASPLVLVEGMAMGLPCVTTDVGDAAELVGNLGIVVPPQSPSSLARALATMAENIEKGRVDRNAIIQRAQKEFSLASMAARFCELHSHGVEHRPCI